jgi:hypothetical protein
LHTRSFSPEWLKSAGMSGSVMVDGLAAAARDLRRRTPPVDKAGLR